MQAQVFSLRYLHIPENLNVAGLVKYTGSATSAM